MSQENVEIVRRIIESNNRGDIDAALVEAAGDFEMDWSNSISPLKGTYRAHCSGTIRQRLGSEVGPLPKWPR